MPLNRRLDKKKKVAHLHVGVLLSGEKKNLEMPLNQRIGKENVVHLHSGVLQAE